MRDVRPTDPDTCVEFLIAVAKAAERRGDQEAFERLYGKVYMLQKRLLQMYRDFSKNDDSGF